jgi:thiamine biosynthesis lipoprotein
MRFSISLLFFIFAFGTHADPQILDNAEEAFKKANTEQKPVFLVFSGSDWCLPCIRFEKKILADSSFIRFASRTLILLNADFPQLKKLSREILEQNEDLARRYNPNGNFPFLLLLKADKTVLTSVDYINQSPRDFIEELSGYLHSTHMLKEYTRRKKLMGSAFEFIVSACDDQAGETLLDESVREVERIETLLTEFNDDSQTSIINRHAGIKEVEVGDEAFNLIQRCKDISRLSCGAFDISAGPLKKLYNFKGAHFLLPDKNTIAAALKKTGYEKIILDPPGKVYLNESGMHISFAAIGKGYAADMVKKMLVGKGVKAGVINASGDLTAWGLRSYGEAWKTGIAYPDNPSKIILWLPVNGFSVATSGNYIQYFDVNGIRYSHNIDPNTGLPVTGIKSVTVISPSAELSDALATAVTVMGRKAGIYLIDQLPETHCILVDDHNKVFSSSQISIRHAL